MITIRLERDDITPHLTRLLAAAEPGGGLYQVLGRAAANTLKKHFRARNSEPNKLGGKRTNFWSRVAQSVQSAQSRSREILIPITHPAIAQKVHGGTITAKKTKNLAIPIHALAHGKSPRVFTNLEFATTGAGVKLLGMKSDGGEMKWLYVLKKSVTQKADPRALPKDAEVIAAMDKAAAIYLRTKK